MKQNPDDAHDMRHAARGTPVPSAPSDDGVDPRVFAHRLIVCLSEIWCAARPVEQLLSWVDDTVYARLSTRVALAHHATAYGGDETPADVWRHASIGPMRLSRHLNGDVECTAIVRLHNRTRVIAMTLTPRPHGWLARRLDVL